MKQLEITTQVGCPLMCTFCPQDKLRQSYTDPVKKMSLDTFTTVLNKLPNDVEIIFAGYTEPWANKLCNQFVKLALEKNYRIAIYTTLYNITIDECDELVSILLQYKHLVKEIWIHLPDAQGNMLGFKYSQEYVTVLQKIKSLKLKGIMVAEMTMDDKAAVDKQINVVTKPVNWYLHTRADNLTRENIKGQAVREPPKYSYIVECTRNKDYHSNILMPNGDVILCCMDYGLKHRLGNLLTQSYDEILNSPEIQRIIHLNNQIEYSDETLCRSCDDGFCRTPWNDKEVYELVKRVAPERLGL